ncbi:twin-arginine translocase TatA/TatE family subunit [Thaumasiovibrio subtropicus]|uniref:twin-arginine translocase TatA/TatE family subunit n=1 Tax=Thaumasiovibrio subtropicus TaxID=1891207 RepID=UPI000B34BD02|nr:twin-arginine translocase TatA/TatE family subunit [Thaumasiovibrio subtropicus]
MAGISIWQLLIIAVIVALVFGTKKLRFVGEDLGKALADFKKASHHDEDPALISTHSDKERSDKEQ